MSQATIFVNEEQMTRFIKQQKQSIADVEGLLARIRQAQTEQPFGHQDVQFTYRRAKDISHQFEKLRRDIQNDVAPHRMMKFGRDNKFMSSHARHITFYLASAVDFAQDRDIINSNSVFSLHVWFEHRDQNINDLKQFLFNDYGISLRNMRHLDTSEQNRQADVDILVLVGNLRPPHNNIICEYVVFQDAPKSVIELMKK